MRFDLDCSLWFQGINKTISRKSQGVISLGRKENKNELLKKAGFCYYLIIATRQKNHPTKLELNKMKTIWRKMANHGKATIEFENPKLILFITEAKPERLLIFLGHLANIQSGKSPTNIQSIENTQQSTNTCFASAIENRQTKMTIRSRNDYPKSNHKGFPSSLQFLILDQLSLRTIDYRWFNLRALTHLSLENNKLGKQWTRIHWNRFCAISRLTNLTLLNLSGNNFIEIPEEFIESLPKITILRLANCKLHCLSNHISCLQNLQLLDISSNPMEELPEDLCFLPNLRRFYLSNMQNLRFLPATIFHNSSNFNRFYELDVSRNGNSFTNGQPLEVNNNDVLNRRVQVPSLVIIAAATVLNNLQYLRPDSSHIINSWTRDCLPRFVHQEMRNSLLRCSVCHRLYPSSSQLNGDYFYRVQLRSFVSSILIGESRAVIRLQLCSNCPKQSIKGNFRQRILQPMLNREPQNAVQPPLSPILDLHL